MTRQQPDMEQPLLGTSAALQPAQLERRISLAVYLSLAGNIALLLAKCYVSPDLFCITSLSV
jgi:hypothetical protein